MSWLAAFFADMAEKIIMLLGGDLLDYLQKKKAEQQAQQDAIDAAKKSVEPLQNSKTGQEISNASDSALDGF